MARNRKYQSAAIQFGPPLKVFLFCSLIGGSALGYVWQKDQISQLGRQIKRYEMRLDELQQQSDKLVRQLGTMRSPQFLERRIQELGLGLVPPQPSQIWRLAEPADDWHRVEGERQYAAPRLVRSEPNG